MSNKKLIKFDPAIPAQFKNWFGAPTVLTAEDLQIHNRILCGIFHDVRPDDFNAWILIDELANLVCERLSLRRRRVNVIRKAHNERFERQELELRQDAERRKRELRQIFEPRMGYPSGRDLQTQSRLLVELEINEAKANKELAEIDAEMNTKLAELQKAKDGPIDETACFDQWIGPVERIEERMEVVERNILITQKLLDDHRAGLGQRLGQADEIVDVEFTEKPAPAREEAVARPESPCNTEVSKALTEPMTASNVAEFTSPASGQTNGGAPAQLDGHVASAPPPSSGPTEQQ
jgi:hypothetical protein